MSQEITLNNLVKEYFSSLLQIYPHLGLDLDINISTKLPDMSMEVIDREKGLIKLTLERLEDISFEDLSLDGKVQYLSFRDYLRLRLFFIEDWQLWRMYPESLDILIKILTYILYNPKISLEEKVVQIAEYLDDLHRFLELSKQRIRRPLKLLVELGLLMVTYLKQLLTYIEEEAGKDPKAAKVFSKYKQRFDRAMDYLDDYKNWLTNLRQRELFDISMGEQLLEKLIRVRKLGSSVKRIQNILKADILKIEEEIDRKLAVMNMSSLRDYLESVREVTYKDPYMISSRYEQVFVDTRRLLLENNLLELPEIELDINIVPFRAYYVTPIFSYRTTVLDGKLKIEIYIRVKDEEDAKWHNEFETQLRIVREIIPGSALISYYLKKSGNLLQKILDIPEYQVGWGYFVQDMMVDVGILSGEDMELLNLVEKYKLALLAKMDLEMNLGKITHVQAAKFLKQADGVFSDDEIIIGTMEIMTTPTMHLSNYLAYKFYKRMIRILRGISDEGPHATERDMEKERESKIFNYRWFAEEIFKYAVTPHRYLESLLLRDYASDKIDREFRG